MGAKKKSTTLKNLFDLDTKSTTSNKFAKEIILNGGKNSSISLQSNENEEIFSIISYCTKIFTFIDPLESPSRLDLKRLKLVQLLSIIKIRKIPFPNFILSPLISMLSINLFRPLPPSSNPSLSSDLPDDEEPAPMPTPSWPHLQLVYDILLRLVMNNESKILREFIDHTFVLNLLNLFHSEDPRERESLKNVYHRIYSKFSFYRSFMRKSMHDMFLQYIFEIEKHQGIGELLEIWGSIINGFTVPLKEEHKLFLIRVLIPLHKTKGMQNFHRQLGYCVSQFVQKEPVLGGIVVRGILKYWPITNCQKEVLLIGELEEVVENVDIDQYRKLALPLCAQITTCLNSCNSQVAERALYVWNNEHFVKMASSAMEEVFPIMVEGMEKNLKWHWSKSVKQLTENVKIMLEEMDPSLYSKCVEDLKHREFKLSQEEIQRKIKWEKIELAASKNHFLKQQK